jgi:hypothetical protein
VITLEELSQDASCKVGTNSTFKNARTQLDQTQGLRKAITRITPEFTSQEGSKAVTKLARREFATQVSKKPPVPAFDLHSGKTGNLKLRPAREDEADEPSKYSGWWLLPMLLIGISSWYLLITLLWN